MFSLSILNKKGTVMLHMSVSTNITGVLNCYNIELDDNLLCLKHLHQLLLLLICPQLLKYEKNIHLLYHEVMLWLT